MKTVTIYKLNSEGEDVLVGSLILDGGKITASPKDEFLQHIISSTDIDGVTAESSPEEWLGKLCEYYKSPYLRASRPQ